MKEVKYWLPTFDASTTSDFFSENPLINVFKQEDVRLSMSRRLPTLLVTNLDICFFINLIIYSPHSYCENKKTCLSCLLVVDRSFGPCVKVYENSDDSLDRWQSADFIDWHAEIHNYNKTRSKHFWAIVIRCR